MLRKIFFIDLFCGAGGVTSGIHRARYMGQQFANVLACVNHDPMAIASHEENHPEVLHYTEDIRTLDLSDLRVLVAMKRKQEPDCLIFIWASLECTNFSKAKGGLPRDADSRTLAKHMFRYLEDLQPDGLWIENVEEFMCWGPLDELGKPISKRHGEDYLRWVNTIQSHRYNFDYRILNAADYGAYTSRRRYFAQFMRPGIPIVWPEATHAKKPTVGSLFGSGMEKWKAVKDVLDFSDEGQTIFTRKKPLSEKTLERIYAGLIKYVAGGKDAFITKYFSGKPMGKVISVDGPAGTVTTFGGSQSLVKATFLQKYFSGNPKEMVLSVSSPVGAVTCRDHHSLAQAAFLTKYYGNGDNVSGVNEPAGTITTKDRFTKVQAVWIDKYYSGPHNHQPVDQPAGTVLTNDKHALVITEGGAIGIQVFETDSPCMVKIKQFMASYGIIDIKMRMLKIPELLRIQGFGDGYVLKGTQADQKRFIGNAVEVNQARVLIESSYQAIIGHKALKTA